MSFRQTISIILALAVIALVTAYTLSRAHAAECYTLPTFTADVEKSGDTIIGAVHYHGENSDTLVLIESPTAGIVGAFVKGGCVAGYRPLDGYAAPEQPTVAKPEGGA